MFRKIKNNLSRNIFNARGPKTKRRILVIESDDWGTIRTASKHSIWRLEKKGYKLSECPYNSFDRIESNSDLERLFELCNSFEDVNGNVLKITANTIVTNPDFEKIKESKFKDYHFEYFVETLKRYPDADRVFELYKQGIGHNFFVPQFHGREHVNISRWLSLLQLNRKDCIDAFEERMFSIHSKEFRDYKMELMDALDCDSDQDLEKAKIRTSEGLEIFRQIFGYSSSTFIAPCFIWHSDLLKVLSENGVSSIQGMYYQLEPLLKEGLVYKKRTHHFGQKTKFGQNYLVRNVFFEPSITQNIDNVDHCLKQIQNAFFWNKPAVISSHRLNYISSIDSENGTKGLRALAELIRKVQKKWNNVEFMSSNELGDLIK